MKLIPAAALIAAACGPPPPLVSGVRSSPDDAQRRAIEMGDRVRSDQFEVFPEYPTFADELGLYSSDADRMGMLSNRAWRAVRVIIDTGMHALGWDRQKAVDTSGGRSRRRSRR